MDFFEMIEKMAENGHAPTEGCTLFGIGNDDAIERIKKTYLIKRFSRGGSAEKFVVGPFGSGKTHFVNQLSEVSRQMGCVTAKVNLTKNIDVTSNFVVYREIARQIKCPGDGAVGIRNLMINCMDRIKSKAIEVYNEEGHEEEYLRFWISGLENSNFELDMFARVAKQCFDAYLKNDDEKFDVACRWISGEINNSDFSKMLNVSKVTKAEQNIIAKRANLSLYQLIKLSGYTGTVIAFDEAEQGFSIDPKRKSRLLSFLQSDINSLNELSDGSVLVMYAITPDIQAELMNFAALQQRLQNPGNIGFNEGNTRAPIIDLTRSNNLTIEDIKKELKDIGIRLVDLFCENVDDDFHVRKEEVINHVLEYAERIVDEDISSSDRRIMVKGTCSMLIHLEEAGEISNMTVNPNPELDTFEDEV